MRKIKMFNTITLKYINKYKKFNKVSKKIQKDNINKTYEFCRLIWSTIERRFIIKIKKKKKIVVNFQFLRCLKLNDFKLGWNHKVAKYRAKLEKKKQEKMRKKKEKAARKRRVEPKKQKRRVIPKRNIYLKRSKNLLKDRDFSDLKNIIRSVYESPEGNTLKKDVIQDLS